MAAALASSHTTSSHNVSKSKTNIKTNDLDRKNSIAPNSNYRSTSQIPSMSKSNFDQNEQRVNRNINNDESHRKRCTYNLNDLVWAKLNNHPWWPCKIVNDSYHIFQRKIGEKQMYFVELIGSNIEKAWVFDTNIFKYEGFDLFKTYAQDQVDKATSKTAKEELAKRFELKFAPNKKEEWDGAIDFADKTLLAQNQNKLELKRKRENFNSKDSGTNCTLNRMNFKNENHVKTNLISSNLMLPNQDLKNCVKKLKQPEKIIKHENLVDFNNNKRNFEDLSEDENENENICEEYSIDDQTTDNCEHTTLSSIINEQKERMKKKRGRKPKSPNRNFNIVNLYPDNELKLKIKLNNIPKIKEENLSDNEFMIKPNRSRSNSSSSESSRSSSSSSSSSGSSCSSASSDSTSCSSDTNEFDNVTDFKKNYSPTSSNWSNSTDYELSSLNGHQYGMTRNPSDNSIVERINVKKQNARKSSTSFCVSSPTPSLPTPNKRKQSIKTSGRKRNSKSLSEPANIDNSLFDENNLLSSAQNFNESIISGSGGNTTPETYLIDRYKYAVRHIKQGLSVEEACNKYRISKGALLKCLSGGTAPRGKKTRLTESEENEIVEWLINYKELKYNEAIHLVFEQVAQKFEHAQRPNPFNNGKPSMDWWYDFLSRHPQIMASKPDWLKRGKVNDQYIKDVQSGHLKCTKFRRALLSAIQYIKSQNDPASASILESVTVSETSPLSTPCSSLNDNKSKQNQKINPQKLPKIKSNKIKQLPRNLKNSDLFVNSDKRSYPSSLASTPIQQNIYPNLTSNNSSLLNDSFQAVIHNRNNSNCSSTTVTTNSIDFNDEDLSSVSPISLINSKLTHNHVVTKSEDLFISSEFNKPHEFVNQFVNSENLSDDGDEEENNENNFEDDANGNVTYNTEIFNSELDDNDFEGLIDPNELIEKDHHRNHQENFVNQQFFTETKYSNDMLFNSHLKYQDYNQNIDPDNFISVKQQPMVYNNHILNMSHILPEMIERPTYEQHHHHHHNHHHHQIYNNHLMYHEHNTNSLLGRDDDDSQNNHKLIHDHDDEGLICDPIYPSAYLH